MKKRFIKTPLVGVQVHSAKDVGTRTVNLLMGEHAGEYVRGDIMDANAVIQAFDEIKGSVDTDHDSLEEVVDEIRNLRDATDQNFEVFQKKVEEEVTRAKAAEAENKAEIAAEAARAKQAEAAITSDVTKKLAQKVDTTTLNEQVGTLNAAIDTKQPKGNYLTEHQSLEEYAKKVELPTVPTKVSELQNDSKFIVKSVYDEKIAALEARIAALEAKHPKTAE